MVRVTSPGGRVLVWDHNPRNPYWRLLMARVPQDTGEERLVGVRELVRGLADAGAEPVLVTQLGMVPDFTPRGPARRRGRRRARGGADPAPAPGLRPQRGPRGQALMAGSQAASPHCPFRSPRLVHTHRERADALIGLCLDLAIPPGKLAENGVPQLLVPRRATALRHREQPPVAGCGDGAAVTAAGGAT